MALNYTVMEGRIPFDLELKGGGDKTSVLTVPLSVRRNYKPEGEQYYPEDLIYCKVFGKQAEIIEKHFSKGDNIILTGRIQVGNEYENKAGETVKPGLEFIVSSFEFPSAQKNGRSNEEKQSSSVKSAPKAAAGKKTPLTAKKRLGPLSA